MIKDLSRLVRAETGVRLHPFLRPILQTGHRPPPLPSPFTSVFAVLSLWFYCRVCRSIAFFGLAFLRPWLFLFFPFSSGFSFWLWGVGKAEEILERGGLPRILDYPSDYSILVGLIVARLEVSVVVKSFCFPPSSVVGLGVEG